MCELAQGLHPAHVTGSMVPFSCWPRIDLSCGTPRSSHEINILIMHRLSQDIFEMTQALARFCKVLQDCHLQHMIRWDPSLSPHTSTQHLRTLGVQAHVYPLLVQDPLHSGRPNSDFLNLRSCSSALRQIVNSWPLGVKLKGLHDMEHSNSLNHFQKIEKLQLHTPSAQCSTAAANRLTTDKDVLQGVTSLTLRASISSKDSNW